MKYTTEQRIAIVPTAEYIQKYRHVQQYIKACKDCPAYGHRWGCPPFDDDPQPELSDYRLVTLIAIKITPEEANLPLSEATEIIAKVRYDFEPHLLKMESECAGRAALFTGQCHLCPGKECTRISGMPCRHPDLVRPSLEALGFDLGATCHDLFGIDLLWGENGKMPAYLTIIGGIFHQ